MSAMQDFYAGPVSVDAMVARAQAERSKALADLIRQFPAKLNRLLAQVQASIPTTIGGKIA